MLSEPLFSTGPRARVGAHVVLEDGDEDVPVVAAGDGLEEREDGVGDGS